MPKPALSEEVRALISISGFLLAWENGQGWKIWKQKDADVKGVPSPLTRVWRLGHKLQSLEDWQATLVALCKKEEVTTY